MFDATRRKALEHLVTRPGKDLQLSPCPWETTRGQDVAWEINKEVMTSLKTHGGVATARLMHFFKQYAYCQIFDARTSSSTLVLVEPVATKPKVMGAGFKSAFDSLGETKSALKTLPKSVNIPAPRLVCIEPNPGPITDLNLEQLPKVAAVAPPHKPEMPGPIHTLAKGQVTEEDVTRIEQTQLYGDTVRLTTINVRGTFFNKPAKVGEVISKMTVQQADFLSLTEVSVTRSEIRSAVHDLKASAQAAGIPNDVINNLRLLWPDGNKLILEETTE